MIRIPCLATVLFALCAATSSAQVLGDRTEATDCASAIGGNVVDSAISVVCGMPHEVVERLVDALASDDPRAAG